MNAQHIVWWCAFFMLALYIQWLVPGLDVMVIGLILILQERSYRNIFWLLPLIVALQEGMGSREFGGMLLWYAMVIGLFMTGRWLFEVENLFFVFLLSAGMGGAYFAIIYILAPLQNLHVDTEAVLRASLIQALFVPCAWWLAHISRKMTLTLGTDGHEQKS